jgi:hypothetical protein
MFSLQQIAKALGGEIVAGSVHAPGPGHRPIDRSMCVTPSARAPRGVLVHSFSEKDDDLTCLDYVCSRLGLDHWKPNGQGGAKGKSTSAKRTPLKTTTYEFRDPSTGDLRYRKTRRDFSDGTKDFYFEKPARNGGPPLLYRGELLAEAIKEGASVFVVEGERCVDALMELGSFAVSTDTGSKSKWTPENARLLCDLPLILWPDSDEAGEKYIASTAAAIRAQNPLADIRVVRPFPRAVSGEKGKDACDWEGDEEALKTLIEAAEPYEAPAERAGNGHDAAPEEPDGFYRAPGEPAASNSHDPKPAPIIKPTPYVWRDPKTLPPRPWLYGGHLIRGFASATIGAGGVGKTMLALVEAMAMATGRPLLGSRPPRPLRVWYWCGEDPRSEIDKRVAAICLHYDIKPEEFEGRLFIDSGRDLEIVIATNERTGCKIAVPTVDAVVAALKSNAIDVLSIDPFVRCHRVSENDNIAMDAVAATWAKIAEKADCAVELLHHTRKLGGGEVTVESGRGAVSFSDACRSVRVLNHMTEDEKCKARVDCRKSYFRMNIDKQNMAASSGAATWFRIVSVPLGNGLDGVGDEIGVVTPWKWPDALEGLSTHDLRKVQEKIASGEWAKSVQAKDWAGHAVAEVLDLDLADKCDRARIVSLLKIWMENKVLKEATGHDTRTGRDRPMIVVGERV